MSSTGTVNDDIQMFDLNSYEHIHTWPWLPDVDTMWMQKRENICHIACSQTVDHVAVCAGNTIKVLGMVEKRLVNGELHENVGNPYQSMKPNPA